MRILVVEDNETVAAQLAGALREANFAVDVAHSGEDGYELGETHDYAAVLLDINLQSGMDGITVLQTWRKRGRTMPVLLLTVKDRWTEKVAGLEAGAHDYITKPYHIEEVLARVWTHIRIAGGNKASPELDCGPLNLDTRSMRDILLDGAALPLTATEFRLLAHLMLNKGRVVGRQELTQQIYDLDDEHESNTLDVFIYKIRKKLGAQKALLKTVPGRGYVLAEAAEEQPEADGG